MLLSRVRVRNVRGTYGPMVESASGTRVAVKDRESNTILLANVSLEVNL